MSKQEVMKIRKVGRRRLYDTLTDHLSIKTPYPNTIYFIKYIKIKKEVMFANSHLDKSNSVDFIEVLCKILRKYRYFLAFFLKIWYLTIKQVSVR